MTIIVNPLSPSHPSTSLLFVEIIDGDNRFTISIGPNAAPKVFNRDYDTGFGASATQCGEGSALVDAKSLGWSGATREGAVRALEAFGISTKDMTDAQIAGRHINFKRLAEILGQSDVQNKIVDMRGQRDPDSFLPAVRAMLKDVSLAANIPIRIHNFPLQTTFWQIKPPKTAVTAG